MSDVTLLLQRIDAGDRPAMESLMDLVHAELRRMAENQLRSEPVAPMQATELVHEAYLRLVDSEGCGSWKGRAYFFGAASEAMRRILVDHARERKTVKRGGGQRAIQLEESLVVAETPADEVLAVDDALRALEQHDEQAAALVKLRYFAGLTHKEAAEVLGLTRRAADRVWALARTWMYRRLRDE